MSTTPVTPDQNSAPSNLSSAVVGNGPAPQITADPSPSPVLHEEGGLEANAPSVGGGSRLGAILSAVASAVGPGIAGAANQRGRASFAGGLAGGAGAELQQQAQQQEIKFKSFDDQVRLSQLHNEDVRLQWADEDHQNAVQANADAQADRMKSTTGMTYTFVPNNDGGKEVWEHMGVQQAQNGAVSVPAGTIAGPKGWYIPNKGSAEQAQANTKDYNARASFYGLPPVSSGVVNDRAYDVLRQMSNGMDMKGNPMHADDLQSRVDNMTEQLTKYKATPNADPNTITAVQSDIDHLSNLQGITDKRDQAAIDKATTQKQEQQKFSSDLQTQQKEAVDNNKAANKANAAQATAGDWLPKVSADEKKKAELAENIAFNANEVAKIVMKRPDILGAVAGRYTNAEQMIGNNDPDISALGVHVHNMAMANSGVHGFRSQEGVESYERQLLNNFKNGPAAMAGALQASTGSVQTFVDNARPSTYKTHSKQGGAVRGMMGGQ